MKLKLVNYIIIVLTFLSCSEEFNNYYEDYNSMRVSESYKKGWIPDIIPKSAVSIFEKHELDNNRVWISFKCSESDWIKISKGLQAANINHILIQTMKSHFNLSDTISFFYLSENESLAIEFNKNKLFYYRDSY